MSLIRIRTVYGAEEAFASREELSDAIAAGWVSSQCEVYHTRADRWLPITSHPAWPTVAIVKSEVTIPLQLAESDMVLINPDFLHDLVV